MVGFTAIPMMPPVSVSTDVILSTRMDCNRTLALNARNISAAIQNASEKIFSREIA